MKKQMLPRISPLIFAAACCLLTVIIAVFAVNNYNREKVLMQERLIQQASTISRYVVGDIRGAIFKASRSDDSSIFSITSIIQSALEQAGEHPDVNFIYLLDEKGRVLWSSKPDRTVKVNISAYAEFITRLQAEKKSEPLSRVLKDLENVRSFQYMKKLKPRTWWDRANRMRRHGYMEQNPPPPMKNKFEENVDGLNEFSDKDLFLLIDLSLEKVSAGVRRQGVQVLALSVVLLLVGVGGWLSLLTLQGLQGSQSRLKEIQSFSDLLITSLPVGLIATDQGKSVQIINKVACHILGISEKEVLNKNVEEVLPPQLFQEARLFASRGEQFKKSEISLSSPSGQKSLEVITHSILDEKQGIASGQLVMIQDRSEMRRLELELRRVERFAALGKVAAGVAHELRNPLSSIKGLALLISKKYGGDENNKSADLMIKEIDRLNRSIGELLEFAKPEKLNKSNMDVVRIVKKSVELLQVDSDAKGIIFQQQGPETAFLLADPDKLSQVFLNVLLNGVQAMLTPGEILVNIIDRSNTIICEIKDLGEGIALADLEHVCDPYFTTKPEGTGLGLSLSTKIIEEHGGAIEIDSNPGFGTNVIITLPKSNELT